MILNDSIKSKYVAVKLKGFPHYIWFESEKVTEELSCFIGKDGWGKGGAHTNIKVNSTEIIGAVYSESLQYTTN